MPAAIATRCNHLWDLGDGVDHVGPTLEYLLIGLRRGLTLGVPPTSSPVVSELLVHVGQLDKRVMTEKETNEVGISISLGQLVSHPSTSSLPCLKQSDTVMV